MADYTALLALNVTKDKAAVVYAAGGRNGLFVWRGVDLSALLLGSAITSAAVNSTTETITKTAHGLITGDAVVATTAVNGLSLKTLYWVIWVDVDNFRLASSWANAKAGTAFNLTGTTNFSIKKHLDSLQGMYVCPTADISGASGAWVRQRENLVVLPEWFSAAGDGTGVAGVGTDDTQAVAAALVQSNAVELSNGKIYRIIDTLTVIKPGQVISGVVRSSSILAAARLARRSMSTSLRSELRSATSSLITAAPTWSILPPMGEASFGDRPSLSLQTTLRR